MSAHAGSLVGRAAAVFGLVLAGLSIATTSGCGSYTHTEQATITPSSSGAGLHVETRRGSVTIREGEGPVMITATFRSRSEARVVEGELIVEETVTSTGPTIVVGAAWPDDRWRRGDGCSFTVTAPPGVGVTVDASNGGVELYGMSGGAVLTTSNGQIIVEGHDGPLELETSNGAVSVRDPTGRVEVRTSNAGVTIERAGGPVIARTSNSGVSVGLTPDNAGPVTLETSNAGVSLDVGPAFAGELEARTSNARVQFGSFDAIFGVAGSSIDKTEGRIVFKDAGLGRSVVRTSNGTVRIGAGG